jgi:hypothetical protein
MWDFDEYIKFMGDVIFYSRCADELKLSLNTKKNYPN